jgi:hypothetical protein
LIYSESKCEFPLSGIVTPYHLPPTKILTVLSQSTRVRGNSASLNSAPHVLPSLSRFFVFASHHSSAAIMSLPPSNEFHEVRDTFIVDLAYQRAEALARTLPDVNAPLDELARWGQDFLQRVVSFIEFVKFALAIFIVFLGGLCRPRERARDCFQRRAHSFHQGGPSGVRGETRALILDMGWHVDAEVCEGMGG